MLSRAACACPSFVKPLAYALAACSARPATSIGADQMGRWHSPPSARPGLHIEPCKSCPDHPGSRYGHLREDWERRAAIKNTIDK